MRRRGIIGIACVILIAVVFGLHSYRRSSFISPPTVGFSPKSPVLPKDCFNLRNTLATSGSSSDGRFLVKNITPLNQDEIAIYKAVIQKWISGNPTSLNVSVRTFPIMANLNSTALVECACAADILSESLLRAMHSSHQLTPEVLEMEKVRLVDPNNQAMIVRSMDPDNVMRRGKSTNAAVEEAFANGLFTLSEIAFDTERKHAIVSYSFVCGSLCGSGNTWVLEKIGGEWKQTDHRCGGWVS